jgi:hypothetical protein
MAALDVRIKKLVMSTNEQNDAMQYVSEKYMLEEWKWSKARVEAVKKHCFKLGGRYWKYDRYEKNVQLFLVTKEETVNDKLLLQDTCEAMMDLEPSDEVLQMLKPAESLFGVTDIDDQQKKDGKKKRGGQTENTSAVKKAKTIDKNSVNEFRNDMTRGIVSAAGLKIQLSSVPFSSDLVQEVADCSIMMERAVADLDELKPEQDIEVFRSVYDKCGMATDRWATAMKTSQARIRDAKPKASKKGV